MKLAKKAAQWISNKLLTPEEKEEVKESREERAIDAEIANLQAKNRRTFKLSKYKEIKNAGRVEYRKPLVKTSVPSNSVVMTRIPAFKGNDIQFNQQGTTDAYPFFETEEWIEMRYEDKVYN